MKLMVGRNRFIYEIYKELLDGTNNIINIYSNNNKKIQLYELKEIADIIIGYFKERIVYQKEEIKEKSINNNDIDNERLKL